MFTNCHNGRGLSKGIGTILMASLRKFHTSTCFSVLVVCEGKKNYLQQHCMLHKERLINPINTTQASDKNVNRLCDAVAGRGGRERGVVGIG